MDSMIFFQIIDAVVIATIAAAQVVTVVPAEKAVAEQSKQVQVIVAPSPAKPASAPSRETDGR